MDQWGLGFFTGPALAGGRRRKSLVFLSVDDLRLRLRLRLRRERAVAEAEVCKGQPECVISAHVLI